MLKCNPGACRTAVVQLRSPQFSGYNNSASGMLPTGCAVCSHCCDVACLTFMHQMVHRRGKGTNRSCQPALHAGLQGLLPT